MPKSSPEETAGGTGSPPAAAGEGAVVREEYEIAYESEAVPRTPTPRTQSSSEEEGKRILGEIRSQSHTIYTTETPGTGAIPKRPRPLYFTPAKKAEPPAKYRAYPKPVEQRDPEPAPTTEQGQRGPEARESLPTVVSKGKLTAAVEEQSRPKPILKKPLFPAREMLERLEPALPALHLREIELPQSLSDRASRRNKGAKIKPYTRHQSPPEKSIEDIIRDAGRGRSRIIPREQHKSLDQITNQTTVPKLSLIHI